MEIVEGISLLAGGAADTGNTRFKVEAVGVANGTEAIRVYARQEAWWNINLT